MRHCRNNHAIVCCFYKIPVFEKKYQGKKKKSKKYLLKAKKIAKKFALPGKK